MLCRYSVGERSVGALSLLKDSFYIVYVVIVSLKMDGVDETCSKYCVI